jgi:NADH:ubiquinone oxidoreductase subunit 2 (subunit N)
LVKPVFIVLLIKVLVCFSNFKVILAPIVFISGLLSLVVGTLGAAFQQKIKRFLALSSISHMGFILMLLGLDFSNVTLALNYLAAYVIANFIVIATISHMRISGPLYPTSRSLVYVSELAFLNGTSIFRSPRTLVISVALFSLAGLPPFLGFFTKLGFFVACVGKFTVLSVLGFVVGLLLMPASVFNYIRIVRVL